VRDRSGGAHRARRDHHAFGAERTRGKDRRHVGGAVQDRRPRAQVGEREPHLVFDGLLAPLREHEVRLDLRRVQRLEQADPEDGAGGAGDADDDALHVPSPQSRSA
jgi:hypothetical protein